MHWRYVVCDAIFMARFYFGGWNIECSTPIDSDPDECKRRINEHIENEYGYDLPMSLDEIRKDYKFDETCQGSVPQAIIAFLESTDFEDAYEMRFRLVEIVIPSQLLREVLQKQLRVFRKR